MTEHNRGIPLNINGPLPRKYSTWIKHFVDGDGYGLCAEFANQMKNEFTELDIVEGYIGSVKSNYHVWCRRGSLIVDPTAAQFEAITRRSTKRAELYHQTKALTKVKRSCPRCGRPIYADIRKCSTYCHIDELRFMSWLVVNYGGDEIWKGRLVNTRLRYDEELDEVFEDLLVERVDTLRHWFQTEPVRIYVDRK